MSTIMKALSVRQPWAWLLAHGHKPVENRTWPTPHRGDTLIHASLVFDNDGLRWVQQNFPEIALPDRYDLGGVVGIAQVVNCVESSSSRWFFGPYGFAMYGARPLAFVPMRGALGFFNVPMTDALHASLHGQTPEQAEAAGQVRLFG